MDRGSRFFRNTNINTELQATCWFLAQEEPSRSHEFAYSERDDAVTGICVVTPAL